MKDEAVMLAGDVTCAVFTVAQPDVILKWVSLALTILCTLITTAFTIYKWYKKAKEDGKIDSDEVKDLVDILGDAKDKIDGISEKGKDEKKDD